MRVTIGTLKEYICENFAFVIVEGRVEDAREKYSEMSDETFDALVANQPAGSNNKYLMWCCKQVNDGYSKEVTIQSLRLFDGNKQRLEKKDINQYSEPGVVDDAVEKLGGPSKSKQAQQARADTNVIYQDDRFIVVRPHTAEASCKYGTGTKWCIASTASRNYFSSYSSSNNKFYFVIDKQIKDNSPSSKFAIAIINPELSNETIQVYDAADKQVGLARVRKHVGESWPEIWNKIQSHLSTNPITREVEESRKEVEEHVEDLLSGKQVSAEAMEKITREAKLTQPLVGALIRKFKESPGSIDSSHTQKDVFRNLSGRAGELSSSSAMELIQFMQSIAPPRHGYWFGHYHLDNLLKWSHLTPENFSDLVNSSLENEDTLRMIVYNPDVPKSIIEKLAAQIDIVKTKDLKNEIYLQLIKKGIITKEQFKDAVSNDDDNSVSSVVLKSPEIAAKLPPDFLRMLPIANGHHLKLLLALPNTPADLSAELISKHWKMLKKYELYELLKTVNLPVEMIEKIWSDNKDQHVRTSLLQNPAIGVENAVKLASSRNSAYRFAVSHNSVLPEETLDKLAEDESASTRSAVAAHPNASAKTLTRLAKDEATVVRASVASNGKTPLNVLQVLKRDSDEFVRKSARVTLKTLETTESFIRTTLNFLNEEMSDDEPSDDIMTPDWQQISYGVIDLKEFVAIVLLQNNGSATREEIEEAYQLWPNKTHQSIWLGGTDRPVQGRDIWNLLKAIEKYDSQPVRTTTSTGNGWFWSPPGINKGSIYRLTPTGASAAMEALARVRSKHPEKKWVTRPTSPVKKSPPPMELSPQTTARQPTHGAKKTTYKIYGKTKGHPVSTRLKGQLYVGSADTKFTPGEQAVISMTDDGKLKVKKTDSDHTQTWDPTDS